MKKHRRVILLLTACVRPNSDHDGWSEYIDLRRSEYLRAVRWYAEHTPYDIVLCENSGTDLSLELSNLNRGGATTH